MDRSEIDGGLNELRADVLNILADSEDEGDFWPAFAGEVDMIEDEATSAEDCRYVRNYLNRMLQQAGITERL